MEWIWVFLQMQHFRFLDLSKEQLCSILVFGNVRFYKVVRVNHDNVASRGAVGRTHTIVRFQTKSVEKMERRISGVSYMCWMDFHNAILCCGFLCARLISVYFVSIFCLFGLFFSHFRLPRRGLPRPIYTARATYHAFITTARLPRLSLSRLPRHSSLFYSWVITPELWRFYHTRTSGYHTSNSL